MRIPYWICTRCDLPVKETRFPLDPEEPAPTCPRCGGQDRLDIVIGTDETPMGDAGRVVGDEDTVLSL